MHGAGDAACAAEREAGQDVKHAYENVPQYKKRFDEIGLRPEDIRGIEDLEKIPFTGKTDFRDKSPVRHVRGSDGPGCPDPREFRHYRQIDGCRLYAQRCRDRAELMARTLGAGGTTKGDIVQNAYGYGLFTGGLGAHYGAERIGAIRCADLRRDTKRQIQIMQDFGCTVLCCTPSYALLVGETAAEMGLDPHRASGQGRISRRGTMDRGGMRREIERLLGIDALDIGRSSSSEVMVREFPMNAWKKSACIRTRTTLLPRLLTPKQTKCCDPGARGENWSLQA